MLDVDPDLGAGLDDGMERVARARVTATVTELETGHVDLAGRFKQPSGHGLLVLSGLVCREVLVAGRKTTELLGPGEVLRPWEHEQPSPVRPEVHWLALSPSELAVLDESFVDRVRPWPQITDVLLSRAVRRAHTLAVVRAISSHKRLDMRVLLLFWLLADRWGRVRSGGEVWLEMPLTHRLIGELVGAERPSVSTALGRLAQLGLLTREGDGWIVHGGLDGDLDSVLDRLRNGHLARKRPSRDDGASAAT